MNQKEATEIVVNYLNPIFVERGYKYKKSNWFGFVKQYEDGFMRFALSFSNYWPIQQPSFFVAKRFDTIEEIYNNLVDVFDLNKTGNRKTNGTLYFSFESLNFAHRNIFLNGGETKEEMLADAKKIEKFMVDVGFPMLDKYDLKVIDAVINGDDFWKNDWQKEFTLGGGFDYKRLIIAKLFNNPRYHEMYQFHLNEYEQIKQKYPDEPETIINGFNIFQYLIEVLLKDVKPI